MRRHRPFNLTALAVVGLIILGGCSGDEPKSLGPVPTAPSTSSTAPAPSTTAAPASTVRSTTTTTVGPVLVNGIPQVVATPARARIGDRVHIEGAGFTDAMWRGPNPPLWLAGAGGGCDLYAELNGSPSVSRDGLLTGDFTVPFSGNCRMSDQTRLLTAGTYRIVFACTPCSVGALEVTTSAQACHDVAFAPNSDNLASAIVAAGMDCSEAEAFVRRAGAQLGPANGPATLNVEGFSCVRTATSDRGLPSADYACDSGSKRLTFHRT